jgi:hypothetical protein
MEFTYDNIVKWMKEYFKAYDKYAQDPKTTHRMHDYYAPDLEMIDYIAGVSKLSSRDEFLRLMSSHPSSHETLTPEDIVVDERRKIVVVLAKTEITDTTTGEVLVVERYLVHYQLVMDESNTVKIRKIVLFKEVLPPGTLDVGDVFMRDPGMADIFTDVG